MIIQHNIMALNAHRQLGGNTSLVSKNLEKLSSGFKINRAGDDAAGLAISEKMRAQITGLSRAQSNAQDGISLVQTAEGALTEVHSMLNRMVDLATQSSNGTMQATDRNKIQDEMNALNSEIERISQSTNFNGIKLLDGSLAGGKSDATLNLGGLELKASIGVANTTSTVEIKGKATGAAGAIDVTIADDGTLTIELGTVAAGKYSLDAISQAVQAKAKAIVDADPTKANVKKLLNFRLEGASDISMATANATTTGAVALANNAAGGALSLTIGDTNDGFNKVAVAVDNMGATGLGITGLSVADQTAAGDAVATIKTAIETVSKNRSAMGALQNRLEHTINNLGVTTENMTAAESRVRDVDMAKEMMTFTKNNVLTQAAQAMLAQANQQPQQVLQLLR
ncbi:MAG: flagellin [Angelakisella sp.]